MEIAIQQLRRGGDFLQIKNRNLHLYVSEFLALQKAKEQKKNPFFFRSKVERYLSLQQKDKNYMVCVLYMCLTLRNCCLNLPDVCIFFSSV